MNSNLLRLLNGIVLNGELSAFAKKILEKEGINESSDDVAKFIIECITAKATEGKMKMVGISDATMEKLVVSAVEYLPEWRNEKTQPKAETKPVAKTTKAETKVEKKETRNKNFDVDSIKVSDTAKKFVQTEIEFDLF